VKSPGSLGVTRELRRLMVLALLTILAVMLCERWSEAEHPTHPLVQDAKAAPARR
jgi:hypothetical protein